MERCSVVGEHTRLSMFLPYKVLVKRCTAVTLCLLNQKSGKRGLPITHHRLKDDHPAADICPVRAVLRQLRSSKKHPKFQRHIISTYVTKKNELATISAQTVTAALKRCVKMLKLEEIGISNSLVSTHSLRFGGATAMFLNGISEIVIKKMGRWSSNTFLLYIQEQLSIFLRDVPKRMSHKIPFHNTRLAVMPVITF